LFWNKLFPFSFKQKPIIKKEIFSMWFKIVVASIPAAVVGLLWDDEIDALFYNHITVSIALIVFGILFIIIEDRNKGKAPKVRTIADITYPLAITIGVFQLIAAVFPGTSRSGATILGALLIGLSRTVAAEFTFFLAIPAMAGASLLKIVKFGFDYTNLEIAVLFSGMIVAFLVSVFVIKFLMGYIKKNDFKVFGWYRIFLGAIVLGYYVINTFIIK
jgi:undecaprenyl-diphosphatase